MSDKKYVLMINVMDRQRLLELFGDPTITQSFVDLGVLVEQTISRLLYQHEILDRSYHPDEGHWLASFQMKSESMARDFEEIRLAIELAADKIIQQCLKEVFGNGTGMRIRSVCAVREVDEGYAGSFLDLVTDWLENYRETSLNAAHKLDQALCAEFDRIVKDKDIRTVLQPIVLLKSREVVGYEALTRGPEGSLLEAPDKLFDLAHRLGHSCEFELFCAQLAMDRTEGKLAEDKYLTINLGPDALCKAASALSFRGRENIFVELTEHMPIDEAEMLLPAIDQLKRMNVGFALDDTGCGFADLETTQILKPDVVKLCISVIRNADKSVHFLDAIRETTETLVSQGCRVLAEGVETDEQHSALHTCPIDFAQGWLYGRPFPVELL